ncbi:hypothetical protein [Ancylobacter terrae]|uniref:hypothetical protein n=1 Tax=Ancylobacter sp. sgz301288 TaxID=3342077 RepID=UPI00385C4FE1
MAIETVYVVQTFKAGPRGGLRAEPASRARNEAMAVRTAERLALAKTGVVAFATSGDVDSGEFDDEPKILFKAGRLPPQFGDEG